MNESHPVKGNLAAPQLDWVENESGNWLPKNALFHIKIWKDEDGWYYPMADLGNLVWKPTYKHTELSVAKADANAFHAAITSAVEEAVKPLREALAGIAGGADCSTVYGARYIARAALSQAPAGREKEE